MGHESAFLDLALLAAILLTLAARAAAQTPIALQDSNWFDLRDVSSMTLLLIIPPADRFLDPRMGVDGNWSTVGLQIGSSAHKVNILVSTALSELWVVGPGGCLITSRGGIFRPAKSKTWSPLGFWGLGLPYLGYGSSGEYGTDTVRSVGGTFDLGFAMTQMLISAINTTDYFLGLFGLGIHQGGFGNKVIESPMTQAVKSLGRIASYSYGYTAGAHYRNTPVSATLGGYDRSRLRPHDTVFTLHKEEGIPRPLVRGIQLAVDRKEDKPDFWSSSIEILSDWNSSFTAIIDSTTPYLWLPESVCDRFAGALNLTYNSTFDLYTITNEQYQMFTSKSSIAFTFSLTSFDNRDHLGLPLQVPGLINITLPLMAFVGLLKYPFMGGVIKYGAPAVPYFMLRKARNDKFIIGRAFLQESYLITRFDEALFSIHQAKFPINHLSDAQFVVIQQPSDSPYPPPHTSKMGSRLGLGPMIGITTAVIVICAIIFAICICRRRRLPHSSEVLDECCDQKNAMPPSIPSVTRASVFKIFRKLAWRNLPRRQEPTELQVAQDPAEAPDCQIYELPAPLPPAELDGDENSMVDTDPDNEISQDLTGYELARRRLEKKLQGPVPEYAPPANGAVLVAEKAAPGVSSPQTNQTTDQQSPISPTRSHGADASSNIFLLSEPSPVSPRAEWDSGSSGLPSRATGSIPQTVFSFSTGSQGGHDGSPLLTTSRSHSVASTAPVSPVLDIPPMPPASFQRTPIGASRVVCLGPIPSNVNFLRHNMTGRYARPEGRNSCTPNAASSAPYTDGSSGTSYTEEGLVAEIARQGNQHGDEPSAQLTRAEPRQLSSLAHATGGPAYLNSISESGPCPHQQRIDPGRDLVHVPQMAEKRYSWEEGGGEGTRTSDWGFSESRSSNL